MSDGITDAAKMTEEALRKFQLQYLKDIPTCYMVDEISKREGVTEYIIPPEGGYTVHAYWKDNDRVQVNNGPARILVVID